ncbi:molybdopterin-dependent oxidoreductase [Geobacter sp. FeAm09]|uniref:molybdopterin-dependent oxidoreductase n=1 Tax=Geobacter sp. FeAm09 TaxID=2597769 RepID=UPI0011EDE3F4|nr:molybdopterin-dependent oxidoreductase [Geobacter sp. FeAm09]QEM68969.1 molybdopterin-dependent oxidoreductase [Geobacter sp. FeAm09]
MNHTENTNPETKPHGKHKYGPEYMSHELKVTGRVERPLCLSVSDLREMAALEIEALPIICGSGTEKGTIKSYRGVLLQEILDRAAVIITEHHAPNRLYLKLTSNDGYMALFSWQEINNTAVGDKAIVVFEREGQPLDENEGEFAFVSANDDRPGPRRMRYLGQIEVCEAV